ncbi:MAG: SURF1 family cytochrome oxidase biogenesis protein [Sphingomicrobium sp.]
MSRKIPALPTLLVAAAVAIMIALGIWQLSRAQWKDGLIEQYRTASKLPPIAFPTAPANAPPPLFRWATGYCLQPVTHRATAGANRDGESGYVHIVHCTTGAEGPGMAVELGWSTDPRAKWRWTGGPVTGVIAPDRVHRVRLVAASAPEGLEPSALPSLESIPTNHRFYAVQWFLFAAIALGIYIIALRKRLREE